MEISIVSDIAPLDEQKERGEGGERAEHRRNWSRNSVLRGTGEILPNQRIVLPIERHPASPRLIFLRARSIARVSPRD